jgi:hypothetical protein
MHVLPWNIQGNKPLDSITGGLIYWPDSPFAFQGLCSMALFSATLQQTLPILLNTVQAYEQIATVE